MNNFKKKSISILCKVGQFGVGKSLTLGMYDFEVPQKLMICNSKKNNIGIKEFEHNKY